MISIIVAYTKKGKVIGQNNTLPWHISEDLKRFKEITTGNVVIMGKNTYKSIFDMIGKPLPNRQNIVISSTLKKDALPTEVMLAKNYDDAVNIAKDLNKDIFIIGGQMVYKDAINDENVQEIIATEIDLNIDGDAFFPDFSLANWEIISNEEKSDNNINYNFITYRRLS